MVYLAAGSAAAGWSRECGDAGSACCCADSVQQRHMPMLVPHCCSCACTVIVPSHSSYAQYELSIATLLASLLHKWPPPNRTSCSA